MISVTDVRVRPAENMGNLKAFADITIDECFVVHGLKVIDGKKGLFVGMPSRKGKERFYDTAHPINNEARKVIVDAVMNAYNAMSAG